MRLFAEEKFQKSVAHDVRFSQIWAEFGPMKKVLKETFKSKTSARFLGQSSIILEVYACGNV